MAENEIEPGRRKSTAKSGSGNMTRSKALLTMGAMAAGIPFLKNAIADHSMTGRGSVQDVNNVLNDPVISKAISELEYLTPADKFIVQRRGTPVISEIPQENLPAIGLTRETWKLEIIPDPESNSDLGNPLSNAKGNALDWASLMTLAKSHAVSYLHILTCTNSTKVYGMGLWEGVPLRDVLWLAEPRQNIRRIFYSGFHNDDPKQIFQSSLPINRVLEEAPGELPVILCYKLNGQYLSQANGGPVRLIAPGFYGNRSIKWMQQIWVTNQYQANDTYAERNNDVESPIKSCSRFIDTPEKVKTGLPFTVTGQAQVGNCGLSKVQYWLHPAGQTLPEDDPYLTKGDWRDAVILPPPLKWGRDLPDGKLPHVMQIDSKSGKPLSWPIPYTIVHWAAQIKVTETGEFDLRCRTIDLNGIAQPLPRPFGLSGINKIEVVRITAEHG